MLFSLCPSAVLINPITEECRTENESEYATSPHPDPISGYGGKCTFHAGNFLEISCVVFKNHAHVALYFMICTDHFNIKIFFKSCAIHKTCLRYVAPDILE